MSQPKKIGQCAYCGEMHPITNDHIPPQNFFPKPRASNLITVPCCETCREELPGVQFPELRIVQDGVFCYTFKETETDPNSGIWLLLFYRNLPLVGFIRLPPELQIAL